ncbi:hypothetical protein OG216_33740 [Streptomycetaceae bacterium NBC_01309]
MRRAAPHTVWCRRRPAVPVPPLVRTLVLRYERVALLAAFTFLVLFRSFV